MIGKVNPARSDAGRILRFLINNSMKYLLFSIIINKLLYSLALLCHLYDAVAPDAPSDTVKDKACSTR